VHAGTPQALPVAVWRHVPLQQSLGCEHVAPRFTQPGPVSPKRPPSPTPPDDPPPEDAAPDEPPLEAPEDPPDDAPSCPESCPVVASLVVASVVDPEELPEDEEDAPDEAPPDELAPDEAPPPEAPDEPTSLVASPGPSLPPVDVLLPQPTAVMAAPMKAIVANAERRRRVLIAALLGHGTLREARNLPGLTLFSHPWKGVATGNRPYQWGGGALQRRQ
jgi:hypothetical protein